MKHIYPQARSCLFTSYTSCTMTPCQPPAAPLLPAVPPLSELVSAGSSAFFLQLLSQPPLCFWAAAAQLGILRIRPQAAAAQPGILRICPQTVPLQNPLLPIRQPLIPVLFFRSSARMPKRSPLPGTNPTSLRSSGPGTRKPPKLSPSQPVPPKSRSCFRLFPRFRSVNRPMR